MHVFKDLIPVLDFCKCLNRSKGFDDPDYEKKHKNVLVMHIPLPFLVINYK